MFREERENYKSVGENPSGFIGKFWVNEENYSGISSKIQKNRDMKSRIKRRR